VGGGPDGQGPDDSDERCCDNSDGENSRARSAVRSNLAGSIGSVARSTWMRRRISRSSIAIGPQVVAKPFEPALDMGLHAVLGQLEELGDLGQAQPKQCASNVQVRCWGVRSLSARPRAGSTHGAASFASVRNRDIGVGRRIRRVRD
jgi:hypothetical protein